MEPVFDGHNDALTCEDHAQLASGRGGGHLDLPRMREGGMRGGIFSVFVASARERRRPVSRDDGVREYALSPRVPTQRAAASATATAGRLFGLERAGALTVARTIADVDMARSPEVPPVAVLHLEGAEAIDPDLESLELWYEAGLRSLGPVWSRPNAFGHGVPFISPSSPDTGAGLTDAGRALVRRCSELGILVDLSHLNAAGFWDVAQLQVGPLVASHSGVHRLCGCSRNLTDPQLDAIGASGGLVGVVFATPFLRPDFAEDPDTPLELIAAHARYIADRIGVEHVALGSDFDGAPIPGTLADVSRLPLLLGTLSDAGFTPKELRMIAWDNWRRVLAAWWSAKGP